MPEEGQPGRSAVTVFCPVMRSENTPHHVFIDVGSKGFIDLLCDPWQCYVLPSYRPTRLKYPRVRQGLLRNTLL
jgi:hypothetical protein